MRTALKVVLGSGLLSLASASGIPRTLSDFRSRTAFAKNCTLSPLGEGQDDTPQVLSTIEQCGHDGLTTFTAGEYNITSKMTWDLQNSHVDLLGFLSFQPDIEYWLDSNNTYRVIFIQNQASWFVLTGSNFTVDAQGTGGINGNGQSWWSYFANRTKEDGDGRPVSLTLSNVTNATIANFQIQAQPFWCNAVADSVDVIYDGMSCNATNGDPAWFGTNIVPNTDGINTYRSDHITLKNFDITCGDDCLAIKGNSTNLLAQGITCRGGNGIAFGSLGQYVNLTDLVLNVTLEDVQFERLNSSIQPNMVNGAYFKSWTGTVNGDPPTGGGGGTGLVQNITLRNFVVNDVGLPTHIYQTNGGHSADLPSTLQFGNITWSNWTGTSTGSTLVEIACSSAAPCLNLIFDNFDVVVPNGATASYSCSNVASEEGLPVACGNSNSP